MTIDVSVSLDRSGLAGIPTPLVFYGLDGIGIWGLRSLAIPGWVPRNTYLPDSQDVVGSELKASTLQQGIISFIAKPSVANEAALANATSELFAALAQFAFPVTTEINGVTQTWDGHRGRAELAAGGERTFVDLRDSNPSYVVSIPVYPIPA